MTKETFSGEASMNVTERADAFDAAQQLIEMYKQGLNRSDVVLSMERSYGAEVYTLHAEKTATWTGLQKVLVCRDNIWGATVEGTTVRVFID